ncbi:hypothetical protein C0995_013366 [Termitomyces sp. Mi166|nr:hypothetical protein C0995_013366 [Termitomyces sp. Mi166\
MSHTLDRSPVKDEDIDIIPPPSRLAPTIHTFQLESSDSPRAGARQSSPEASSPASSDFSLSLDNSFPSEPDRRAWVARPRNRFIIFRCEYSRQHAKEGKRVRRPPGTATEKTISKRAAEAWHQLSAEEKNRFKERAKQEKEEHARRYPDYRFRPVKKGTAQKKEPALVSKSKSQPLIPSPTPEPVIAPPQPPQQQELMITQLQLQPPQPLVDIALVKAGRRRSASVPLLTIGGGHPSTSGEWTAAQPPGLRMKRSRSVLGNRPPSLSLSSTTSPYEGQSFDPRMFEVDPSSGYIAPEDSYGTVQDSSQRTLPYPYQYPPSDSLTTAVDPIHLSSWNSEICTPEATTPWSSSPLADLQLLHSQGSFSQYEYNSTSLDASDMNDIMIDYPHEDEWASASTEYSSYSSVQASLGLESSGMLFSPTALYNNDIAAAPEYRQEVDIHTAVENQYPEEAMLALNINDYLHQTQ